MGIVAKVYQSNDSLHSLRDVTSTSVLRLCECVLDNNGHITTSNNGVYMCLLLCLGRITMLIKQNKTSLMRAASHKIMVTVNMTMIPMIMLMMLMTLTMRMVITMTMTMIMMQLAIERNFFV